MGKIEELLEKSLINLTKSENKDYSQIIHYIKDNEIEKLTQFIKSNKIDLNNRYGAKLLPLEYAFYRKNEEIINVLIALGANINYEDKDYKKNKNEQYPILSTASIFDDKIFESLINQGMKVNNKTAQNCLYMSLVNYRPTIAKLLVKNGTDYKKLKYKGIPYPMQVEIQKVIEEMEIMKEKEKMEKSVQDNINTHKIKI